MTYVLGVIGGSGLYNLPNVRVLEQLQVDTPFGRPSDKLVRAEIDGNPLLFLPRHGIGHTLGPQEVNVRANICALKKCGATHVVSLSAVGSMKEEIEPGHVVVVDQYIDLTKHRVATFFDRGIAAHVPMAEPACPALAAAAVRAAEEAGARVHPGGTYVCIEGPQFSTRAESDVYRSWGVSVIGMTAAPEAKLAREAELPYVTVALVTDYDCWHQGHESVSVETVLAILGQNAARAGEIVSRLCRILPDPATSPATGSLRNAIITDKDRITTEAKQRLEWLLIPNPGKHDR